MEWLFISDLDGTLLQPNASLSPHANEHLRKWLDQGIHFSIATGRSVISMQEIMGDLPIKLPVIASNGAYVSDYASGRHSHVQNIKPEICSEILSIIHTQGFFPFVSTYDGKLDHLYYDKIVNGGMAWYERERLLAKDRRLQMTDNWKRVLKDQIVSFNIIEEWSKIQPLYQEIFEKFGEYLHLHVYENEYKEGWCWFAIQDLHATKANGISILLDMMGYHVDQVTVFGDNLNDISMFQYIPHAIAVQNAHPDIKALARDIIDHHEKDSVISYMKKMLS